MTKISKTYGGMWGTNPGNILLRGRPLPKCWYHSEGNWMLYNSCRWKFLYIMKLCSRLFVLHCRSRPKYDSDRLSYFGRLRRSRTKSLLQSFIIYKNCQRRSCRAFNCLSSGIDILVGGRPLPPEILAQSDQPSPEDCEFWHVLPCSASTVRNRKNKNSARAFQRAIDQGSTPPPTSSKLGDQNA